MFSYRKNNFPQFGGKLLKVSFYQVIFSVLAAESYFISFAVNYFALIKGV